MTRTFHDRLKQKSAEEAFSRLLGMDAVHVGDGTAKVRMLVRPELENIFGATHGGALFSLIDEAFQLACNTHGVLAVALNVSVTYVSRPDPGSVIEAVADEVHKTKRTASYFCEIREVDGGKLIATANALAYRTGKEVDFDGD